mgnify:CR=1 FL=1
MKSVVEYINNNFSFKSITFSLIFISIFSLKVLKANENLNSNKSGDQKSLNQIKKFFNNEIKLSSLNWEKFFQHNQRNNPKWQKLDFDEIYKINRKLYELNKNTNNKKLTILNRSIVVNNRVGPDISWLIPPGFSWNSKHKFDFNVRGHNSHIPSPPNRNFFGWNDGDAIGLFSYQFLHLKKSSFGINTGFRSLYQGDKALGGDSKLGEGVSAGFRYDYELSDTSGFAVGAEQLIHFDSMTDSGRNIYLTTSKGWWKKNEGEFPLYVATAGLGTGRMAVGTVKGFCSGLFDGAGTETRTKRNLCWAPVFSLASVWNEKFSNFFEYNSRFFLLGTSYAPLENIPIRGTFALMLSDHIDNYKLKNFEELNWVFNISIGF